MKGINYRTVQEIIDDGADVKDGRVVLFSTKDDVERVCIDPAPVVEKLEEIERELSRWSLGHAPNITVLSDLGRHLLRDLRLDLDRRVVAARTGK